MRKLFILFLLIIAGSTIAKAQWGYDPYSVQLQMFQMQQMQQAAQMIQQYQQQMIQNFQVPAAAPIVTAPVIAPVYTPSNVQSSTPNQNWDERKRDILNSTYGEQCKACHGTGKCHACNGTKVAKSFGNTYRCTICNENGSCSACGGTGLTSWNR